MSFKRILEGVRSFQEHRYAQSEDLFKGLIGGQSPEVLFITCSDSRVDPMLLTHAKPGELFMMQNAGNIVPAAGESSEGARGSVEYAVKALKVQHIVVCGHAHCGAMTGLLHPEGLKELPEVAQWLTYAEQSKTNLMARIKKEPALANMSDEETLTCLIQENVTTQLDNLRTSPAVQARIDEGSLMLHGWVYDFGHGKVDVFCNKARKFVPFEKAYSDTLMVA